MFVGPAIAPLFRAFAPGLSGLFRVSTFLASEIVSRLDITGCDIRFHMIYGIPPCSVS